MMIDRFSHQRLTALGGGFNRSTQRIGWTSQPASGSRASSLAVRL